MAESPVDALERQYACTRGIPLSIFRGRVVNPGEPYWLPADIEAALKWQLAENLRCPGCGYSKAETMRREDEVDYDAEAVICHACREIANASAKRAGRDDTYDPMAGVMFRVIDRTAS